MIIHTEFQQHSLEWLTARAGVPTASEFDQLVTPKWEIRKGQMVESYLAKKLAEAWMGGPLPGFCTLDMDLGTILEDEARPWYALETGREVQSVGFVTTDDGRIGCSPDGLIGDDGGIEIKCPEPHTHTRYLINGGLPNDYAAQVQGSLYVTGRPWWAFLSYRRRFPKLLLTIEPERDAQAAIGDALAMFLDRFDRGMKRLEEMNGGPRPSLQPTPPTTPPVQTEEEPCDIIP
jgi:hypothetical protein